jgi:tRNA threonylcarbamoyl adenosine modification protein YjeE
MGQIVFEKTFAEGEQVLLRLLGQELLLKAGFVLWLNGEMGAGKTSLVRALLRSFGLSEDTPVVSPTYTIMNEYQIDLDWYAHLDLYRADHDFSLEQLGVLDARNYRGVFIEWPEQAGSNESLPATHILTITAESWEHRLYQLERC